MNKDIREVYKDLNKEFKAKAIAEIHKAIPKHEPQSIIQLLYTGKIVHKYLNTYWDILAKYTIENEALLKQNNKEITERAKDIEVNDPQLVK